MVISAAMRQDLQLAGQQRPGQHRTTRTLLPIRRCDQRIGVHEAHQRRQVLPSAGVSDPTLNAAALGNKGIQACGYTKAAYIVDRYNSPSAVNPDVDPNIVGASGIFTTAEYQANRTTARPAAVMKLVIDGNAAAGTIEMGGFDYHSGNRMDGEERI